MQQPKITVVTVCYNAEKDIERTMLSVLGQTYENLEYILIDGASTDSTLDVIRSVAARYPKCDIRITSEIDKGIYDAMNKGIKQATGDWINFMNAGDAFYDMETIREVKPYLRDEYEIVYGDVVKRIYGYRYKYNLPPIDKMTTEMAVSHQATFVKMSYHKAHLFDTSFHSSGDYNFFYNAYFKDRAGFYRVPLTIADYNDEEGMSRNNLRLVFFENLRIWGKDKDRYAKMIMSIRLLYVNVRKFIIKLLPIEEQKTLKIYNLRRHGFNPIKEGF